MRGTHVMGAREGRVLDLGRVGAAGCCLGAEHEGGPRYWVLDEGAGAWRLEKMVWYSYYPFRARGGSDLRWLAW